MGEGVSLVREPDAGDLHVRFDERRLETERKTRIEAPASPATSYSPRRADTAPVVDSPQGVVRIYCTRGGGFAGTCSNRNHWCVTSTP